MEADVVQGRAVRAATPREATPALRAAGSTQWAAALAVPSSKSRPRRASRPSSASPWRVIARRRLLWSTVGRWARGLVALVVELRA